MLKFNTSASPILLEALSRQLSALMESFFQHHPHVDQKGLSQILLKQVLESRERQGTWQQLAQVKKCALQKVLDEKIIFVFCKHFATQCND